MGMNNNRHLTIGWVSTCNNSDSSRGWDTIVWHNKGVITLPLTQSEGVGNGDVT